MAPSGKTGQRIKETDKKEEMNKNWKTMKKPIILFLTGILTSLGMVAQKPMDGFMVQVDGLGCPFCAYGLEKKFKEFKGIKDIKIDIETGDFNFRYPTEKELTMEAVLRQVEKAGYTPITAMIERASGEIETFGDGQTPQASTDSRIAGEAIVPGNCNMCKTRIEKAARTVDGVFIAAWDNDSKTLSVQFNPKATSMDAIERSVAKAGHDTQNHQAHTDDYGNLPACCKYERLNH